jgi:hypothetical protein
LYCPLASFGPGFIQAKQLQRQKVVTLWIETSQLVERKVTYCPLQYTEVTMSTTLHLQLFWFSPDINAPLGEAMLQNSSADSATWKK